MFKNPLFKTGSIALALSSSLLACNPSISTDGTGDFLVGPAYIAEGNTCTEIKVMNTNKSSSILAKISIREYQASYEIDLPILLSPSDVWNGYICDSKGKVLLTSTDDSNHREVKDLLSKGVDLAQIHRESIYSYTPKKYNRGYIEIYPIAQYNEGMERKVHKGELEERWERLMKGDQKFYPKPEPVDNDSLTGFVSLINKNCDYLKVTLPMIAFEDSQDELAPLNAIKYEVETRPEALLGPDKRQLILKSLQKSEVYVPYDNHGSNQEVLLTFIFDHKMENQRRIYDVFITDMEENRPPERRRIFSPPKESKFRVVPNELGVVEVEDIIKNTPFKDGMLHLKNLENQHGGQLGAGQIASVIPTMITKKYINEEPVIVDWTYLPSKYLHAKNKNKKTELK